MNNNDPVVNICLPVSKVNIVISGLAELPYKLAADTIATVKQQAEIELQRQQQFMAQTNPEPAPVQTADPAQQQ